MLFCKLLAEHCMPAGQFLPGFASKNFIFFDWIIFKILSWCLFNLLFPITLLILQIIHNKVQLGTSYRCLKLEIYHCWVSCWSLGATIRKMIEINSETFKPSFSKIFASGSFDILVRDDCILQFMKFRKIVPE